MGRESKRQGKLVLYLVTNMLDMVAATVRAECSSSSPTQTVGWVRRAGRDQHH